MIPVLFTAFQALAARKMRSFLTMLGTVIGVACVVAVWNIGASGRAYMANALSAIGQNLIMIRAKYDATDQGNPHLRFRPLKQREYEAVRDGCPLLDAVSPVQFIRADCVAGAQRKHTTICGCAPAYLRMRGWEAASGRLFSDADLSASARVVLLGERVARELFGNLDACGQRVRVNQAPFTVVGVLAAKGSLFADNQDDCAIVPHTAGTDYLGAGREFPMLCAATGLREDIPRAKNEIRLALRQAQNLQVGVADAFEVEDLGEMASAVDKVLAGVALLLGAIGAVSLLVGGIGIMNIMLVSVTERIREIGLRMALGATDAAILVQFLIEAGVLSCVGGVIGMGIGVALALGAAKVLSLVSGVEWPGVVSAGSLVAAFGFSVAIGLFFGFYPAWRASRMDPIEALRHE